MKRFLSILCITGLIMIVLFLLINDFIYQNPFYFIRPGIKVDNIVVSRDKDKDGISDPDDILQGARLEIKNKTVYRSEYYVGGYPPNTEGVCTDVVWRALWNSGYDLKAAMDRDIRDDTGRYARSIKAPDPNIDFRRVKNQYVYFKKYAQSLTLEVKPYDKDNLKEWQRGDIVILRNQDHVAVISDKRRRDGVPYVIHNSNTFPMETNSLMRWYREKRIIGHFRYYGPFTLN